VFSFGFVIQQYTAVKNEGIEIVPKVQSFNFLTSFCCYQVLLFVGCENLFLARFTF